MPEDPNFERPDDLDSNYDQTLGNTEEARQEFGDEDISPKMWDAAFMLDATSSSGIPQMGFAEAGNMPAPPQTPQDYLTQFDVYAGQEATNIDFGVVDAPIQPVEREHLFALPQESITTFSPKPDTGGGPYWENPKNWDDTKPVFAVDLTPLEQWHKQQTGEDYEFWKGRDKDGNIATFGRPRDPDSDFAKTPEREFADSMEKFTELFHKKKEQLWQAVPGDQQQPAFQTDQVEGNLQRNSTPGMVGVMATAADAANSSFVSLLEVMVTNLVNLQSQFDRLQDKLEGADDAEF